MAEQHEKPKNDPVSKEKKGSKQIWVKAKQRGLYLNLREEGDVFQIENEGQLSELWMERTRVDSEIPAA